MQRNVTNVTEKKERRNKRLKTLIANTVVCLFRSRKVKDFREENEYDGSQRR
jgi:hypothetical protein